VSVFAGSVAGIGASPIVVLSAITPGSGVRSLSAAGDVNNDGFADLLVGSGSGNGGFVTVFHGGLTGLPPSPTQRLDGPTMEEHFGQSVEHAGDVNGDGFSDVIVGAWIADPGGRMDAGTASFFLGGSSGVITTPSRVLEGVTAGDGFGYNVVWRRMFGVSTLVASYSRPWQTAKIL
jgi:hypothetical protein